MGHNQKYELWGTFSVWDHTRPGAFLAEVILYDTLVIPVPPDPNRAAPGKDLDFALKQWERWERNKWDPRRLMELVEILRPVAEPVEWDREHHEEWAWQFDQYEQGGAVAGNLIGQALAGYLTGQQLLADLPAKAAGAVAVCPYTSLDDLKRDLGITETSDLVERQRASAHLPENVVSAVVGREFLMPADPALSELDLLREAVDLVQQEDWRSARQAYHAGLLEFGADGKTDFDSVRSAVETMASQVSELGKIAGRRERWKRLRRACFFMQVASDVPTWPVAPWKAAGTFASIGQFTASEKLGNQSDLALGCAAGALLVEAQDKLGLMMAAAE